MSATASDPGLSLAAEVSRELVAAHRRIRDLEDTVTQLRRDLDYAEFCANGLRAKLRAAEAGGR